MQGDILQVLIRQLQVQVCPILAVILTFDQLSGVTMPSETIVCNKLAMKIA